MMNLDRILGLVERLRKDAIGEPQWISDSQVFEYQDHSAKVVAVLKLARAAQGLAALRMLCDHGLFIDFGVTMRCVNDCVWEIFFLLEEYPTASNSVDQFVRAFFASTIDGHLTNDTPPVPTKKIRTALVRVLKGGQDEQMRAATDRIYKTFCGYVHANYAHIMEVYSGATRNFNLAGVPSIKQRQMRVAHVEQAALTVLYCAAFTAHKLGLCGVHRSIMQASEQL